MGRSGCLLSFDLIFAIRNSQLAAIMFLIFQTLGLWKINCNHWLKTYLTACAENYGKAPGSPSLPGMEKAKQIGFPSLP